MKIREPVSSAGAGDSIPVKMQTRSRSIKATLALAILSLALFALPGPALADVTNDVTNDPTAAQYTPPAQAVPPAQVTPPTQGPTQAGPPTKSPEKPSENLQAGLGAGVERPAETVAVPVADSGPSLPFTGLDVAALAAVALALAGTGVVLRRLATIGDSEK